MSYERKAIKDLLRVMVENLGKKERIFNYLYLFQLSFMAMQIKLIVVVTCSRSHTYGLLTKCEVKDG